MRHDAFPSSAIAAAAVLALAPCSSPLAAQAVPFIPGANMRSVAEFGATPNDGLDDLAAFQAALNATVGSSRILYVPNGTYSFSGRLNWGGIGSGGFFTLQGESQAGVILRLNDNAAGFNNPGSPLVFIDAYDGNTANQFRNYLRDVTIDTGANNPGAVGLQFQANNTGRIENVTIRSSDALKRGVTGLDQGFEFPGPLLIRNLTIDGFDTGYVGAPQEYSVVFENLTLRNQLVQGIYVWRLPIQIRNLVSQNAVPTLVSDSNPGAWGHVVVDGGTITGLPGAATVNAFINRNSAGVMILRDITIAGYQNAVADFSFNPTTPTTVPTGAVSQYITDGPASLNPSPTNILPLPIDESPDRPTIPLAQWASVKTFGAIENDNLDDTAAIQAAMNSGASVVYFPSGSYILSDTITVGPAVRRVEGLMSDITINAPLTTENRPVFRVPPGSQAIVHFSGVNTSFQSPAQTGGGVLIEQATANTLVIRDGDLTFRNTVPGGKVFIENIVGTNMTFTGQKVWARQLNPEGSGGTHVINDAGDLYVLGLKTEGTSIALDSRNRARSTIMGGLIYPSTAITDRSTPMFINNESSLSFSIPESAYADPNNAYDIWVRETRGGVTTNFTRAMLPLGRGHSVLGGQIALYNGYATDASPSSTPGNPTLVTRDLSSYTITWPAAVDAQSGIARYNIYRGGTFYRCTSTNSLTELNLPDDTGFAYRVSAVNGAGVESPQSGVFATATLRDQTPPRLLSAATGLDPRYVILTFSEPLATVPAQTAANYALPGPSAVAVTAAVLSADGTTVTLTTSGMSPGLHTLALSGLTDRSTTPNALPEGELACFTYSSTSSGSGLTATYWSGNTFVGTPLLTRIDATVNFDYGLGPAAPGLPADNFAVRWTGRLRPRFSEPTTLSIRSDDGSRIFLDGQLIVGNWFDQGPTERGATVTLDSSRDYDLVVEYYENGFGASVELFWQSASQPKQIIPQSALFPDRLLTTVRTSSGVGADIDLSRFFPGPGTGDSMGAFHSPAAGGFHQAAYWRLDLSSLNLSSNYIESAVGTLSQTFFGIGDGKRLINIFAVNQAPTADFWTESGPGFVTWQTAAGNSDSGSQASPTASRWMSTYLLDNTGFQNNNQPDKLAFGGPRLLEALNADTDGRITFIAKRFDASNEGQSWFTKEWAVPDFAPSLKVRLAPRCPQVAVQPIAPPSITQGQSLTLSAVVRGAPTLTYQWRLDGVPVADGSTYVGASTPSLTVRAQSAAAAGVYTLHVSNTCGTTTTTPVTVVVVPTACNPADIAATDGTPGPDNAVDNGDFSLFFTEFFAANCPACGTPPPTTTPCNPADIAATDGSAGPDGCIDNGDFSLFFTSFFAGCP